jgi:hypothetical protein
MPASTTAASGLCRSMMMLVAGGAAQAMKTKKNGTQRMRGNFT